MLKLLPGFNVGIHPNEVAGTLLWVVPMQFALLLHIWSDGHDQHTRSSRLLRAALLAAFVLSAATLLLTQSRAALVGMVLVLVGLAFWRIAWARLALGAAVVVVSVVAIYTGPMQLAQGLLNAVGSGAENGLGSLATRVGIWSSAIQAIIDFPLTGIGMNQVRVLFPAMYLVFSLMASADIGHAHNQFLQAALDLGLPGMVAYLTILLIAAPLVARTWRDSADRLVRNAAVAVGFSLLAWTVYGMFDTIPIGAKPGIFLWALLALTVLAWRSSEVAALCPRDPPSRKRRPRLPGGSARSSSNSPRRGRSHW